MIPRDVTLALIGALLLSTLQFVVKWSTRLAMIRKLSKYDSIPIWPIIPGTERPYGYIGAYKELKRRGWPSYRTVFPAKS